MSNFPSKCFSSNWFVQIPTFALSIQDSKESCQKLNDVLQSTRHTLNEKLNHTEKERSKQVKVKATDSESVKSLTGLVLCLIAV